MKIFSKRWFSSLLAAVILLTAATSSTLTDVSIKPVTGASGDYTLGSSADSDIVNLTIHDIANMSAKSGFEYNGVTYNSRYERTLAEDGFIYGMVQPWEGNDVGFGNSDLTGTKKYYDEEVYYETLLNCKAMGVNSVKIWVFRGLMGLDFDEYGNATIDQDFMKNLESCIKLAKKIDIGITLTIFPHLDYSLHRYGKDKYDIGTQFMFDPEKHDDTMKNVIKPFAEFVKKYEDTITMLEIICEPDGDVNDPSQGSTKPFGPTWDTMIKFITKCEQTIHSVMPNMPVTVASGNGDWNKLQDGTFNKMGLDIIGNDVYNDTGELADLSTLKLNAPAILGEFGLKSTDNWSDEFQIRVYRAFFENAKAGGYVGAFAWHLGFKHNPGHLSSQSFTNPDGSLRPAVAAIHFMTLDNKYERTGDTPLIDKPVFLGGSDHKNIKFFGSRTADRYEIYRSTDKTNWTKIQEYDAFEIDNGYYICNFSDATAQVGKTYYYRIKAISDMDEAETFSDASHGFFITEITCAPEDNYLKNYDFSDTADLIPGITNDYKGWSVNWCTHGSQISIEQVQDAYFGNTPKNVAKIVGVGQYDALIQTDVKLKPQTKYTFTFTAKGVDTENLESSCTVKVASWEPEGEKNLLGGYIDIKKNGEWYTFSTTFKTLDYNVENGVTVYFGEYFGTYYLTDVYLFETPLATE